MRGRVVTWASQKGLPRPRAYVPLFQWLHKPGLHSSPDHSAPGSHRRPTASPTTLSPGSEAGKLADAMRCQAKARLAVVVRRSRASLLAGPLS